jgi:tRNA A-37 threonylcarbamoyl transferase component Bud32
MGTVMSTLVGTCLNGRYRLDAQIGAGGMSTVYRAFDMTLERQVAVKLMHREIASDSDQLERFRREARSVAQLSHPHIVGVIDAGEEDGRPYIVFEYVEGETLKERIRRMGRLPIDEAIAYAIEIARALGAAHARNIVHRDIKPQNVLVDEEGSAKVTDFGIARSLEEEGLTADGRVLGTTDYVSPEQALGHDVDGQSDIYSLGIVLYEMLVGDVPFHGENQVSVAMKHVREDLPDVQIMRPEISARLAAVLDRMTDKDLAARHPDAHTLELDLEDALAAEASRTGTSTGEATAVLRTLPASKRRRLPLRMRMRIPVLLFVLMIAVAGTVIYLVTREAAGRAERGRGGGTSTPAPSEQIVSVKRTSASDFDPLGDQEEHAEEATLAVDQDPGTAWTTEGYQNDTLNKPTGEPGVGLYIDADPGVNGRALEIQTEVPGWEMELYGATERPPADAWPSDVWTKIGGGTVEKRKQRFELDTGNKEYRYYLVWITKLPPGEDSVAITQATLSAPKPDR